MADRRFPTSFKDVPDSDEPGLVLGDDNVVYLIKPDGSRVEVGSGGGGLLTATVSLTNAQILALPTTAIEVIPAQGPGTLILAADSGAFPAVISLGGANVAYTNVNVGCNWLFSNGVVPNWSTGYKAYPLLTYGAPDVSPVIEVCSNDTLNSVSEPTNEQVTNQALAIKLNNQGSGNLTGGDAENTCQVTVLYQVIAIS